MSVYLKDVMEATIEAMKQPVILVDAETNDDVNTSLNDHSVNTPFIAYSKEESLTMLINASKYGYLSYTLTAAFIEIPSDDSEFSKESSLERQLENVYSFFANLRSIRAWSTHPDNRNDISIECRPAFSVFDIGEVGWFVKFTMKINPSFDYDLICD